MPEKWAGEPRIRAAALVEYFKKTKNTKNTSQPHRVLEFALGMNARFSGTQ
jgi:hypothetical protein